MFKMKKTTITKTAKSPAPSTSATATAPAPATKTTRVPRVIAPAALVSNGNGASTSPATAPTTITAKIDVGFGNRLFIRGEGPGLDWNKGTLLDCVADDRWVISISRVKEPVTFKFLLNDEIWSIGDDYVAEPGASFSVTPLF